MIDRFAVAVAGHFFAGAAGDPQRVADLVDGDEPQRRRAVEGGPPLGVVEVHVAGGRVRRRRREEGVRRHPARPVEGRVDAVRVLSGRVVADAEQDADVGDAAQRVGERQPAVGHLDEGHTGHRRPGLERSGQLGHLGGSTQVAGVVDHAPRHDVGRPRGERLGGGPPVGETTSSPRSTTPGSAGSATATTGVGAGVAVGAGPTSATAPTSSSDAPAPPTRRGWGRVVVVRSPRPSRGQRPVITAPAESDTRSWKDCRPD